MSQQTKTTGSNRLSVSQVIDALFAHPCSCINPKNDQGEKVVEIFPNDREVHDCIRAGMEIIPEPKSNTVVITMTRRSLLALRTATGIKSTFVANKKDPGPFFTWDQSERQHIAEITADDMCTILGKVIKNRTGLEVNIKIDVLMATLDKLEQAA